MRLLEQLGAPVARSIADCQTRMRCSEHAANKTAR